MPYPGHPHYIFKVCLIGSGGVGKTCIAKRLCFNTFDAETKMTIGINFYTYDLPILVEGQEENVRLSIWDFGGQAQFKRLFPYYINGANGLFMCFELVNLQSLLSLDWWYDQLKTYDVENVPRIVLGTKQDLIEKGESNIKVDDAIINSFLEKQKEKDFFKTSSKDNVNINTCFKTLSLKILDGIGLKYDKLL
jgi:Ras-related protein Rab-11A